MPQVESVTALVLIGVGSRYEEKKDNGMSHFLEHVVWDGTKTWPTSLALATALDSVGASHNAFTGKEYTGYFVKSAAKHLPLAINLLADLICHPLILESEVEKEKGVITEEINMYEDQPQSRVGEIFEKLLYGEGNLGQRISGEKEHIKLFSKERLENYLHKTYHSLSTVLVIAGKLDQNEVMTLSNQAFGVIAKNQQNNYLQQEVNQGKPEITLSYKKTDQAHLCLGTRGYSLSHPNRYILSVLATILGGSASSRLTHEIREKRGLAYYIGAGSDEYLDCGHLVAQAGLRISAVNEAIKIILEQFNLLKDELVSQEELQKAKDYIQGRMILGLEDSYRVASFYGSQELLEEQMQTPSQIMQKIEKITSQDVQNVAKELFVNKHLNLAVIGPFKKEEEFAKMVAL